MSTTDWLAGALIGVIALAALVAHLAAAWPEPEPCDHAWLPLDRDGRLIRWLLGTPAGEVTAHHGTPHAAHDAIEQWIRHVTDDWRVQAELRRRALDIRHRIDQKETT